MRAIVKPAMNLLVTSCVLGAFHYIRKEVTRLRAESARLRNRVDAINVAISRKSEPSHVYLSTACLHGEHDHCRLTCKYCGSDCRCTHHHAHKDPAPGTA